ncbi:MAG: 4Fe-4S binding protein [Fibrobacter sp.]|jgi:MinD superfamily P-loop ATPase|nr:4Fe-4S binding protein [Fibrobacter sp.]
MKSNTPKELVVVSGKGGTGKTSITASLASFFPKKVLVDGDVDAADLHLLFNLKNTKTEDYYGGSIAEIIQDKCTQCGICESLCRFDAIIFEENRYVVQEMSCEGCKVCVDHCPEKAFLWKPDLNGIWMESETLHGSLIHARLTPGSENSGKLVTHVKEIGKKRAIEQNTPLVIVDGPPGIGCPAIAALTGASGLLMVTEPTPSGLHDLIRILDLAAHFKLKSCVLLNKADINPKYEALIQAEIKKFDASFIGTLPYSKIFTEAQLKGQSIVEAYPDSKESIYLKEIAKRVTSFLGL